MIGVFSAGAGIGALAGGGGAGLGLAGILGIGAAGSSLFSGIMGRRASKSAGKYASRALKHQAWMAGIQGKMTEQQVLDNYKLFKGNMGVARAKSGVTWEGSPTLMAHAAAEASAIDSYVARWNTQEQQNLLHKQARAAKKGASMSGTASAISGATSALSTLYNVFLR